ncbi:Vacuolar protein sorting-associated protein 55-like protein, partial [Cucurbita argyrosperma subsp. sororia]
MLSYNLVINRGLRRRAGDWNRIASRGNVEFSSRIPPLKAFFLDQVAFLAILVSGGIVLQILACALYNNWWPMLSVIMYVLLPMPLLFFAGSDSSSLYTDSSDSWINATKFLTGASTIGSIAIPIILKHAGIIGWGAMAMDLSSFVVFVIAILCFMGMSEDDGYTMF